MHHMCFPELHQMKVKHTEETENSDLYVAPWMNSQQHDVHRLRFTNKPMLIYVYMKTMECFCRHVSCLSNKLKREFKRVPVLMYHQFTCLLFRTET